MAYSYTEPNGKTVVMTAKNVTKNKGEWVESFCDDLSLYLGADGAAKKEKLQQLKTDFRVMVDYLVADMFEQKARNMMMKMVGEYISQQAEKTEAKIEKRVDAKLSEMFKPVQDVIDNSDITAIVQKEREEAEAALESLRAKEDDFKTSIWDVESQIENWLEMTPISESIRVTFKALEEQGVKPTSAEAVEIVKSVAEYQAKVSEKGRRR